MSEVWWDYNRFQYFLDCKKISCSLNNKNEYFFRPKYFLNKKNTFFSKYGPRFCSKSQHKKNIGEEDYDYQQDMLDNEIRCSGPGFNLYFEHNRRDEKFLFN